MLVCAFFDDRCLLLLVVRRLQRCVLCDLNCLLLDAFYFAVVACCLLVVLRGLVLFAGCWTLLLFAVWCNGLVFAAVVCCCLCVVECLLGIIFTC